jgi:hypothetical protein
MYQPLFYSLLLLLPFAYFFLKRFLEKKFQSALVEAMSEDTSAQQAQSTGNTSGSIMQPAREDLAPPLDHPYTVEELKSYDGSDPSKPILVAIKGLLRSAFSKSIYQIKLQGPCLTLLARPMYTAQESPTICLLGKTGQGHWECQV